MAKYQSYTHVVRLGKPEVDGYLKGKVYVTPKFDGTNAVMWAENGEVFCGSRHRKITPQKDNGGFAEWFLNSNDELALVIHDFLREHEDCVVYGEWLGLHKFLGSIKSYKENGLFVFDVAQDGVYLSPEHPISKQLQDILGNHFLKAFACLENPSEEELMTFVENNHENLDSNEVGEGVVLKNYEYRDMYGEQKIAKIVRKEYAENKGHKPKTPRENLEPEIVAAYVTSADIDKAKAKVCVYFDLDEFTQNKKCIGMLMNMVFTDLISEELLEIVKKYHKPTINFSILQKEVVKKVCAELGL